MFKELCENWSKWMNRWKKSQQKKGNYKNNQIDILILRCSISKMKNLQDRLNKRLELEEENINLKIDFFKWPN